MKLRVDLRDIPVTLLDGIAGRFSEDVGLLLSAWQWGLWTRKSTAVPISSRVMLMVPDFLYYARLASTGQMREIVELPESKLEVVQSALRSIPTGIRNIGGIAQGQFWAGAAALMAYDLGLIKSDFAGETVLHYNLSDFTWLFEQRDFLKQYFGLRARGGVATQMLPKALSACSLWNLVPDRIIYTTGISRPEQTVLELARGNDFSQTKWTVDFTQLPADLVRAADGAAFYREIDNEWLVTVEAGLSILNQ